MEMSPETQHAYDMGLTALLGTVMISMVMFAILFYFLKKYKQERDLVYYVLFPKGKPIDIANEVTAAKFRFTKRPSLVTESFSKESKQLLVELIKIHHEVGSVIKKY